jgi:DNA-binding transcriptional MerR regulator
MATPSTRNPDVELPPPPGEVGQQRERPRQKAVTIGAVCKALAQEFPDITISKIRFLEGEGLIQPERTASGYRKFYEGDVDRLRKILKMQRDEYLPLKVIKERLAREGQDSQGPAPEDNGAAADELVEPPTGLQMSLEEMSTATGVEKERIRELEAFGILRPRSMNGEAYFDGDDYVVLSIVKDFFRFGMEPRHLTMYRHFAEREAALFEAIILPMLRQRNPDARRAASEALAELARVSRKLKQALLRTNLRQYASET